MQYQSWGQNNPHWPTHLLVMQWSVNSWHTVPHTLRAQELCESRGGRAGLPVPNKPYGLCGRHATPNLNVRQLKACTHNLLNNHLFSQSDRRRYQGHLLSHCYSYIQAKRFEHLLTNIEFWKPNRAEAATICSYYENWHGYTKTETGQQQQKEAGKKQKQKTTVSWMFSA